MAYDLIEKAHQATLAQLANRRTQADTERADQTDRLQRGLTEQQRGYNVLYNQAINPFGRNMENRGVMGTGVSEYFRNAALGQLLQGQGQAQQSYQDSVSEVDRNWNNYLLELAGLEQDAQRTRASAIDERQRYDAEQERLRLQAEEDKRRYDQEWQRQLALDELNKRKASGGGTGGTGGIDLTGGNSGGYDPAKYNAYRVPWTETGGAQSQAYVPRTPTPSTSKKWIETGGAQSQAYVPRSTRTGVR